MGLDFCDDKLRCQTIEMVAEVKLKKEEEKKKKSLLELKSIRTGGSEFWVYLPFTWILKQPTKDRQTREEEDKESSDEKNGRSGLSVSSNSN